MGMFSWECKGCHQELIQGELVRLNGCGGEYDGYGNAGGFDYCNSGSGDPVAWHQKCYGEATDSQKLDETPSRHARNQGFGFPQADCLPPHRTNYVEPPRVSYAAIPIDHIMVYLKGLWAEDQERENGFTWFRDMTLADMVYDDLKAARESYGERFSHDYVEKTDWGSTDPGQHWRDMEERFQGLHLMVSELAHAAIAITRRRLGGLGPIRSL
jgi:hypothetical protein